MRRAFTVVLLLILLTLPAALALAGTAAYGTARRQAIQAVNAAKTGQGSVQSQKRFLCQVFGLLAAAEQAPGQADDFAGMLANQLLKAGVVTGADSLEQLLFLGGGHFLRVAALR